jgi:hypothetical protein
MRFFRSIVAALSGSIIRVFFGRKPSASTADIIASLSAFLQEGRDQFALLDHVENWLQRGKGYQVLFVNFDALPKVWESVIRFLHLPIGTPCLQIQPRNCCWRNLTPEHQRAICDIYAPLVERLAAMPDTLLVD